MVSLVSPEAKSPSKQETGKRSSRMEGLPVQTLGSTVMCSNFVRFSPPYFLAVDHDPSLSKTVSPNIFELCEATQRVVWTNAVNRKASVI